MRKEEGDEKMTDSTNTSSYSQDTALKLATAIALIKSKLSSSSSSESDSQRWKRKAKERKRELLILKQQLKDIQDGSERDLVPEISSCKCYFFENCGKLSPRGVDLGGDHHWINEVLHRRFLRQVRWRERRKRTEDSVSRQRIELEVNCDDEMERLSTSVDFLVELCDTATLKNLLSRKRDCELLEEIVSSLILRLIRRMCTSVGSDGTENSGFDAHSCVQHIIRKLGSEPFIGQRTMLLVSQKLCILSDCLLLMDPFDDAFPNNHCSMYMITISLHSSQGNKEAVESH
ncbi:protein MULTIPOLAR SPINDLE 1 isoform X1 [Cinnamomum micranthum f. kanehirae]|uniref:Protein MULTIPOLAR SPINDLE 1 isoform X1 n=1 Tax=Cinnamomum micranthum f. kanehirae TaxID=337451 RepID=A0A443PKF8_9MAGN|nr:protein MULTIPOLAR SPINDLE 1 isoform X1 [Cinnamomum micranthum f. kanehirae]